MKIEMNYLERGYQANLLRRRAAELRELAAAKSMSAVKQELELEARYVEDQAARFDRGDAATPNNEAEQGQPREGTQAPSSSLARE